MIKRQFERKCEIDASAETVFDWHKTDRALEKLIPPGDPVEVKSRSGGIQDGATVTLRITIIGPIGMDWVARHQNYAEGEQFQDVQVKGPFKHWKHTHLVEPIAETRCRLIDRVEYALPFGRIGDFLGGWLVRRKLSSMFDYRHEITKQETENKNEQ